MPWQDWVLTIGNIILGAALFPSILSRDKPAILTSLPTGTVLLTFSIAFSSLSLWTSAVAVFIVAVLWYILIIQKIFIDRKKNKNA